MGHARLKTLESGSQLWTGDSFEYLYVLDGDKEHHLPPDVLYQELAWQLQRKVISAAEGCNDWLALAAALHVLKQEQKSETPEISS